MACVDLTSNECDWTVGYLFSQMWVRKYDELQGAKYSYTIRTDYSTVYYSHFYAYSNANCARYQLSQMCTRLTSLIPNGPLRMCRYLNMPFQHQHTPTELLILRLVSPFTYGQEIFSLFSVLTFPSVSYQVLFPLSAVNLTNISLKPLLSLLLPVHNLT